MEDVAGGGSFIERLSIETSGKAPRFGTGAAAAGDANVDPGVENGFGRQERRKGTRLLFVSKGQKKNVSSTVFLCKQTTINKEQRHAPPCRLSMSASQAVKESRDEKEQRTGWSVVSRPRQRRCCVV